MTRHSLWLKTAMFLILALSAAQDLCADAAEDYGPIASRPTGIERPGMVVWMDLLTDDVASAVRFYEDVFSWKFRLHPDGQFALATLAGKPVASIAAFDEGLGGSEGLWLASLSVSDVNEAMESVKANGGAVLEPPEDLPGRGRYVLVEDPTGAAVMLLRADGGDPGLRREAGRWVWAELWTDDVDAATTFYENVLGYRTVTVRDASGSEFRVMGRDQTPHASVVRSPLPGVAPNWLAYLLVDDVNATARRVLEAGGAVLMAPQKDGFNSDIAIVSDPTGGVFALQQREAK